LHLHMLSVAGQVDRHRGSTLIVVPRTVTVIVSSDVITAHTTLTIINAGYKYAPPFCTVSPEKITVLV